jgi:hypothetical protein
MKRVNDQILHLVATILDTLQQSIDCESNKKNIGNHNNSTNDIFEGCIDLADYPIQVDDRIVTAVRREPRQLLVERCIKKNGKYSKYQFFSLTFLPN